MNITVVGAAGRLGQQVAEEASRRSHRVTGLARHPQRMAKPELLSRIAVGDGDHHRVRPHHSARDDVAVAAVADGDAG